jgi:Tol biopolymer transport system component
LALPGDNCSVGGGLQVTVDVVPRSVTNVLFDITCAAVIRPERIAFAIDMIVNGASESWIGLVSPDGSGRTTLVRGDSPAWSRGGDKVVFSNVECFPGYYGIFYGSNCSGGLAFVDPETRKDSTLSQAKNGLGPSWSPTSDVIAFWSAESDFIFLLPPDGSMATPFPLAGLKARDPAWAPDGRRLAFTCWAPGAGTTDICIFDPAGPFVRLNTGRPNNSAPAWSPDGSLIAFTSDGWVAVAEVRSGGVEFLTFGSAPDWSRDGTKLVFEDDGGLYTINADGSNRKQLISGPLHAPAWRR